MGNGVLKQSELQYEQSESINDDNSWVDGF